MRAWVTGSRRLSAEEKAEIADMIGTNPEPEPPPPTGFTLDPTAPLPAKLRGYYRFTYPDYATGALGAPNYQNAKCGRTVKRWVSFGRKCQPPDLPPLDEPARMASWFRRAFPREPVPPVLLSYESHPPPISAASQGAPSAPSTPSATLPGGGMRAISFDAMQAEEGQSVRRARNIEQANGQQVEEASARGDEDAYRRWFPIWKESSNLLRQLEKEDREARKAAGDLIPRGPALAEIAQLIEALRIMHDGMDEKILAELEKSADGKIRRIVKILRPLLKASVGRVRDTECSLFLHIETLESPDALKEQLRAA